MSETIKVTTKPCMECGKTSTLTVPTTGYYQWRRGDYIQNALPELTPDEREMLITGSHPDCWDKMFPQEED